MKRKLTLLGIAAIAMSASAQMGMYSFGIGPLNTATNSNYATTAGYFAGYNGKYDTRTSLFGSLAGQDSYSAQRSVGVGYGALYMASNVTDCVAIGDRAGARWRNATGWVQVGDAFVFTNGYLNIGNGLIKGSAAQGVEIAGLDMPCVYTNGYLDIADGMITGNEREIKVGPRFSTDSGGAYIDDGNLYVSGGGGAGIVYALYTETEETHASWAVVSPSIIAETRDYSPANIRFRDASGNDVMLLAVENGNLCVYTNDVKAGRVSIVPDP